MNLQELFQDAQISIRYGLVPIKATLLGAAILALTGVLSVGLFSLLAVTLCLYNAYSRLDSIGPLGRIGAVARIVASLEAQPNSISTTAVRSLALDSTTKRDALTTAVARLNNTPATLTQYSEAFEAGCQFVGGKVNA